MTKRTLVERLNESSYATIKQTKKQKLNQKSPYNQNQVRPDDKENTGKVFERILPRFRRLRPELRAGRRWSPDEVFRFWKKKKIKKQN